MRFFLLVNFAFADEDCSEEGSACLSEGECVVDSHFGNFIWYPLGEADFPVTTIDAYQANNSDVVDLASCENECINYAGCYQMHYDGQACTLFNDVPQVIDETFSTKLESCNSTDIYEDYYFNMKFYCLFTLTNGQTAEEFLAYLNQFNSDDWRFVVNKSWYSFYYAYTYRYKYVIADSVPSRYFAAGANQVWIAFEGEYYLRWTYQAIASQRRRRQSDAMVDDFILVTSDETTAEFQGTIDAGNATVVETTANERDPIEEVNQNLFTSTSTTEVTTTTTKSTTSTSKSTTTTTEFTTSTSESTTTTTESSAVFMGFNLILSVIFVSL